MIYQFLNIFLDSKELFAHVENEFPINTFLLENNTSQIEKIYEFYNSETNLLLVNGAIGTGKAEIVNYSLKFLSKETVVLKYNCFNSTVLDDILLSFFTEFKHLSSHNVISEPKMRADNFTQKVNSYFSIIDKPILVILDSFEEILEENRHEILDFIYHLYTSDKVKIIIIGRGSETKFFKNVPFENVVSLPFDRQIFDKLLKVEKIKFSKLIIDEFYKHTEGGYFYTMLSIRLMQKNDKNLVDFLKAFQESYLPFNKYLEREAFTLIESSERNLFWFLCLIRHPISINLIKKLNLCNDENLKNLSDNLIILRDDSNIYVQDYLKDDIDESASLNLTQRVHQYIIDLYTTQLPLKPLDRDICVSRQTMRKEIEYHSFFLPKKPKNILNKAVDINFLSYSKSIEFDEKPIAKDFRHKNEEAKPEKPRIDFTQRKNIHINFENLPFQEKNVEKQSQLDSKPDILTLEDLVVKIKRNSKLYQYANVIDLCKRALLMREQPDYKAYLPFIYTKLAYAYQKNAEYDNSLKFYELAMKVQEDAKNFVKVNYIKYYMANIFYDTYKIDQAKVLFKDIINSKDCPVLLVVKSYLHLANIAEDSSNPQEAFEYYKAALSQEGKINDVGVLSELYFKYALNLDDKNDVKSAIEYYEKCIEISSDESKNKFLSPTYSNIATLYYERNEINKAIINYQKAFEIDSETNNMEGIYYSASKLASIMQKIHSPKALEYFNKALESAKNLNDSFYIISATLAVGDYNYDIKQNEIALKYYMQALDMAQSSLSKDNVSKIRTRINDIKFRLGADKFSKLVDIIKSQGE